MAQAIVHQKPTVAIVRGRLWTRRVLCASCWLLPFITFYFVAAPGRTWPTAVLGAFVILSLLAILLRLVERPREIRDVRATGTIPIIR